MTSVVSDRVTVPPVTGLEHLLADTGMIEPARTGLCTNYTAIAADLRRGVDALMEAGVELSCLFAPEHGYWGAVQAGDDVGDAVDERSGLPVIDTYKSNGQRLDRLVSDSGVQQILLDLQDIGTRFYTYTWTLFDLLCTAARTGVRIVVLDRPNPLGGLREGPGLQPPFASFIGRVSIPLQHGLTLGELARWFNAVHVPDIAGRPAQLDVIGVTGWDRGRTGALALPWVLPSPNMPSATTATVYPATGLLEGTVLSEGRGTTRPFELFGATWTSPELAAALNDASLPGVGFREQVFRPTFSKDAGEVVHGVQLHLHDPLAFDPIATGVTILGAIRALHPDEPMWRAPLQGRPPFIDLLWGSAALREGIDDGARVAEILSASPTAPDVPADAVLY